VAKVALNRSRSDDAPTALAKPATPGRPQRSWQSSARPGAGRAAQGHALGPRPADAVRRSARAPRRCRLADHREASAGTGCRARSSPRTFTQRSRAR